MNNDRFYVPVPIKAIDKPSANSINKDHVRLFTYQAFIEATTPSKCFNSATSMGELLSGISDKHFMFSRGKLA